MSRLLSMIQILTNGKNLFVMTLEDLEVLNAFLFENIIPEPLFTFSQAGSCFKNTGKPVDGLDWILWRLVVQTIRVMSNP